MCKTQTLSCWSAGTRLGLSSHFSEDTRLKTPNVVSPGCLEMMSLLQFVLLFSRDIFSCHTGTLCFTKHTLQLCLLSGTEFEPPAFDIPLSIIYLYDNRITRAKVVPSTLMVILQVILPLLYHMNDNLHVHVLLYVVSFVSHRPLWVEFPKETDMFAVENQYMIGKQHTTFNKITLVYCS